MKLIIFLAGAIFGALLIATIPEKPAPLPVVSSVTAVQPSNEEQSIIDLQNAYRAAHGFEKLSVNVRLMNSAQVKADDLCTAGNWSHTDSKGREFQYFIIEAGYEYTRVGENLAKGFNSQPAAFDGLVNSPAHLDNIIGEYTEVGVGYSDCNGQRFTAIHYGKN